VKQLFKIKDAAGSEITQPVLSLWIGEKHLSFAISDFSSKKINQIAWYTAEEINVIKLAEWFKLHPELSIDYYQINVGFNYSQSTIMPFSDFQNNQAMEVLSQLFAINSSSIVVSDPIKEWQLINVHAIPASIFKWIGEKFPIANYRNHYSVKIKSAKAIYNKEILLIDFRPEEFSVIVFNQNKCLLAQTFSYSQPDDVLYYLMRIVVQYSLSQQEVLIQLSGLIDRQSALFNVLHLYFINIEFREGDWVLPANEYPLHFFTSLNDLSRCAL
jgi:hypothetical protein